ncbi:MAG: class I SAM-dependent methyltransferase [Isosphaeraceae bacterium]
MITEPAPGLKERLADFIEQHGEWTAMSIDLGGGVYTIANPGVDTRLKRIVQLAQDLGRKPLSESRVLDLACLEGHYALELAMHGAEALGTEGREANLAKANFARDTLGLSSLRFVQDDVRNLSREKYGTFDIVICSGILYHIDAPDVFRFIERIGEVCTGLAIIDTHISLADDVTLEYNGKRYSGRYYTERPDTVTEEQHEADLWASIGNVRSFWLTRPSLYNILRDSGFTSVLECHLPPMPGMLIDRVTFVAVKGEPARVLSSPITDAHTPGPCQERPPQIVHTCQDPWEIRKKKIKQYVPKPIWSALHSVRQSIRERRGGSHPWEWDVPWKKRKA